MKLSWVYSISRPVEPSRLDSPEPPELSRRQGITKWRVHVLFDPSGFIKSVLDVCFVFVPLSVSVLCSPAEVNLRTIWRRQLLQITTPCRKPDLVSSSTVVNELSLGGSSLTLFKGFGPRMGSPESFIRGLVNHWFIPPLLYKPIFGQPSL